MKAKTNAQLRRLAKKAARDLCYALVLTKCIPEDLGTPVAEEMAEGAIELAADASHRLATITRSLRCARKKVNA